MSFGESDLLAGLVLAGLALLGTSAGLFVCLRRERRRAARAALFGAGAVLLVADGRVIDASEEAVRLLAGDGDGDRDGNGCAAPLGRPAAEVVGGYLGDSPGAGREAALAALRRLEQTGTAFELPAADRAGRSVTLAGRPRGGLVRLELRRAAFLDDAPGADGRGAEALVALLASAPLIAWTRAASGLPAWSAGCIALHQRPVQGAEAAALAAARDGGREAQGPAGPARFRLSIGGEGGAEGAALDAVEVPAAGGGWHGLAVDGTPALEAERALSRFVRTMTETFAHLNVGLAIFDSSQRLALFNPALVEMWQADPAWLAQRPSLREIVDRLRAGRRIPEHADFHAWRARLTGLFDDTEAADYEELWHLADGVDIRVLARPHPHGSLAFVFEDVSERLKLEQRYRHSIELRRATLNRLEEGLAVFGPDGRLQFVNAAFHDIWGTDDETVRPMLHVRELVPLIGGMTVETAAWTRMLGFITGSGARQPWGTRMTLGTGRILGARFAGLPDGSTMALFFDVTDSERFARALRERNEALEAAEEMRTAVLDQISHRLRTPLHAIFGFGQLIADTRFASLSETQQGYAKQILESARQLLAAVDDVAELAALEIDPMGDDDSDLTLGETLALTVRLLQKRAIEQGVSLELAPPDTALRPACEPGRLRQIVFGLATAAIGSCREESRVEIGARRAGSQIEILVSLAPRLPQATAGAPRQCPSLPFIRRLIDQAGGEMQISAAPGTSRLVVSCRFPPADEARSREPVQTAG